MGEHEGQVRFRGAGPADAEEIASLHAQNWRRHYRGAYADSYLDGDVLTDRRTLWTGRLAAPAGTVTVLAEDAQAGDGDGVAGFVHVVLDEDAEWGSLIDNLHVAPAHRRAGIGTALLAHAGRAIAERATHPGAYLWVLEQNTSAQRFYHACGGTQVGRALVPAPGGIPSRLAGTPAGLRIVWPDAAALIRPTSAVP